MDKKITVLLMLALIFTAITVFLLLSRTQNNLTLATIIQKKESVIPPYLVNIFEKEETIKSPIEFANLQQPRFPDRQCPITNYGALGDGKNMDTKAFASAIRDCSSKGGGIVEVPAGNWLTGSIKLESNINLHLDEGANIVFSSNPKNYLPAVFSRYEGIEYNGFSPLIYASHAKNIAITGSGKLDGQGQVWWPKNNMLATYSLYDMALENIPIEQRMFADEKMMLRPSFIQFESCSSILLEDFTIKNSPFWTIHPLYSSDIIMRNININTPGLNTDGIAIDSSKNILIENSTITSGDDAIVVKSGRDTDGLRVNVPSENIVVRNCNIIDGHGGFSFGSETSGGIRNIFIYNNKIDNGTYAIRLKSSIGRGGVVENIWASNISSRRADADCIQMTTNYDVPRTEKDIANPTFRNIHFENITCLKSSGSIRILGLKDNLIENVSFRNVSINSRDGASISNAKNIEFTNVSIKKRYADTPGYLLSGSQDVRISESSCKNIKGRCIQTLK